MDFTDDQLERYARHIILKEVGGAGQAALMRSRVLVIGAGGLGAPLLMYLAAAGVGTIGIVDDDRVELSNLQRQIVHETPAVGRMKTESAAERLAAINPDVTVVPHSVRLEPGNASALIAGYDLVADGSDRFETRFLVNDTCVALGRTLVSAALGPYEGQLATFRPQDGTPERPLPCYRCFVPEDPGEDHQRTCSDSGILGAVAGVMGALQAMEVIKEILGLGDSLAGHLLLYDALSASTRRVRLPADPHCPVCGPGARERVTG